MTDRTAEALIDKVDRLEAENATLKQRLADAEAMVTQKSEQYVAERKAHQATEAECDRAIIERDAAQELNVEDHKEHCRLMRELEAECDRLRQALKPFARVLYLPENGYSPDDSIVINITVADARRATEALTVLSPSETEEGG